ncbi:MAG: hypothetical protein ACFCUO_13390 [Rhodospirillales bacterium]
MRREATTDRGGAAVPVFAATTRPVITERATMRDFFRNNWRDLLLIVAIVATLALITLLGR